KSKVIEDQQIRFGDLTQECGLGLQSGVARELIDESWEPEAADTVVGATGSMATAQARKLLPTPVGPVTMTLRRSRIQPRSVTWPSAARSMPRAALRSRSSRAAVW